MSSSPDFQNRRALVTGGAGFIGSHLVDALLSRGARVRVLDSFATGRLENLTHCLDRIELVERDLRDRDACREACKDVDLVFHQAALGSVPRSMADPATTIEVNVGGTANVFAAAREMGVSRVIYASSSSVYGDSDRLPKREGEEGKPLSPYALSKRMNEELASVFGRCYGIGFVGLRYFNVYGPRQDPQGPYAAVVPRFFKAYLAGESPVIFGDGDQSRDFTYVADAVEANLLAAGCGPEACGRCYNVAGGRRATVNALARRIRDAVGGGPEPRHEPPRAGDIPHSWADLKLAGERLGYVPAFDLEAGIVKSREAYRAMAGGVTAP